MKKRTEGARIDPKKEVITRDKLSPFFEEIKELIKSTAKGTENVLRRELNVINIRLEATQSVVTENTRDIKGLKTEMKGMETRLSDKIDNIGSRVEDHEVSI